MKTASQPSRIHIDRQADYTVYRVQGWPGWGIFLNYLIVVSIIGMMVAALVFMRLQMVNTLEAFGWFGAVMTMLTVGAMPMILEFIFALMILGLPWYLVMHLSAKTVWLDDQYLHVHKNFFSWRRQRRVPRQRIVDIQLGKNGSPGKYLYDVQAVFWLHLPAWFPDFILNKVDRWPATLLNAIPDKNVAVGIQEEMLRSLTDPSREESDSTIPTGDSFLGS